jgi:dTDP-L-rhamnose 4-epimerase
MRILVTGAAGFIGSHVVDALLGSGNEVVALDLLSPHVHPARPDHLAPDAEWMFDDVRDVDAVSRALRGVDAVAHQAGMVGLGVDFGDVSGYVSHNDVGTASLLEAMHRATPVPRLVLASSMVVYGEGAYTCAIDGPVRPLPRRREDLDAGRFDPPCPRCGGALTPQAIDEEAPVDPRNIYAATKVHQEHLCRAFGREHGVPVLALRYHNVYGPRMPRDTPYAGVASIFRSALAAGMPPKVFEDGGQMRNFVHVTDVARANVLGLASDADGAVNVASGEPHTIVEMATALAAATPGSGPAPVVIGGGRIGDVRHIFGSPARAAAVLGFTAEIGFAQGMTAVARDPLRGSVSRPPRT